MVNTRAQASQNNQPREDEMDDFGDNASDLSLPRIALEIENNAHSYGDQERDHVFKTRSCNESVFKN